MASRQIHLFATRNDLEGGIRLIESKRRLKYALCGLFSSPDVHSWLSLSDIEILGKANAGNQSLCEEYLVLDSEAEIKVRGVAQQAGAAKYAVDQLWNPASTCFRPGGRLGEQYLIRGRIGTASNHPDALLLFREFSRCLTRGFEKRHEYLVGPEALMLARAGTRLITMHVDEGREFDLDPA